MKVQALCHSFVFCEIVMVALFLDNFKMLSITPYDGKGYLVVHVEFFWAKMDFERVSKLVRCRAFPVTLLGLA